MLLLVLVTILILTCILIVHYNNHFELNLCKCSSSKQLHGLSNQHGKLQCICKLSPINDETFNFFPKSFLFYIIFNILLCFIIIITQIIDNNDNSLSPQTINQLLFGHSIISIESYHPINSSSLLISSHQSTINIIFDYILLYSIMIISIWESLFAFYRYYTTYKTARQLLTISSSKVFQKFTCYAFIFCILFIAQINWYYWIFPLILSLNFGFNFYCNWSFAAVLIQKYKSFQDMDDKFGSDDNINMLKNVYFLRKTSVFCCCIQSVTFGLIIISYNINTICFLPFLWSLSTATYSMNFVRNRTYLNNKYIKTKQFCCNKSLNRTKEEPTNYTIKVHRTSQVSQISMPTEKPILTISRSANTVTNGYNINKQKLPSLTVEDGVNSNNFDIAPSPDISCMNTMDTMDTLPPPLKLQMRLTKSETRLRFRSKKMDNLDVIEEKACNNNNNNGKIVKNASEPVFGDKNESLHQQNISQSSITYNEQPIGEGTASNSNLTVSVQHLSKSDGPRYTDVDDNNIGMLLRSFNSLREYGFVDQQQKVYATKPKRSLTN